MVKHQLVSFGKYRPDQVTSMQYALVMHLKDLQYIGVEWQFLSSLKFLPMSCTHEQALTDVLTFCDSHATKSWYDNLTYSPIYTVYLTMQTLYFLLPYEGKNQWSGLQEYNGSACH